MPADRRPRLPARGGIPEVVLLGGAAVAAVLLWRWWVRFRAPQELAAERAAAPAHPTRGA